MNFLHPWAIGLGSAAILLPVVIHFLTKPRPVTMPLSTIRFVQNAVKQRRASNWLRDFLVLALRAIAIGCIAWAFAQPRFNSESTATVDTAAKIQRVVILDASQSMSALQSGVDGFQAARVQASRFLKSSTGLRANLIVAGANADAVFEVPSANMNVLNEALGKANAKPERIDIQAAINAASEMLASPQSDTQQEQELVIVSDFQRSNWSTVDFSTLPESTKIKLESTAPEQTPANLAILSVGFPEKPTAGSLARLEIEIGNFSKQPRTVEVEVSLGDTVFTLDQACPPNTSTTLAKEIMVDQAGWQSGWVELVENEDALAADDRYPFVVQTIDSPACTIVTRQSPRDRPSSSYFLERALSPWDNPVAGQMLVSRTRPERFSVESASASQLLVFDHPGRLQQNQIKAIASLMRRGRGVLYVASELVDATNLKLLYDELGGDLRAPVKLRPSQRGVKRNSLTVASVKDKLRPFNVFGDSLTAVLADLRISGGLTTQRVPDSLDDDIRATLDDQSVLLFTTPAGSGKLCVLNADLNQSNWPRHSTFVPVLNELVEDLLRSGGRSENSFCGEPLTRLLPPAITSGADLMVSSESDPASTTDSVASTGVFQQSGEGVLWNWRRPEGPTIHNINQANQTVYALATHIAPEESDLRTLDANVLTERLSGGRQVDFHRIAEQKKEDDKSWIWFAVAAVVAMVGEVFVLKGFRT